MANNEQLLEVKGFSISPELFSKGYAPGAGPCTCTSVCCSGGVYADVTEREKILSYKEMIKKYMDETQITDESQWFDDHEFDDADFPSGRAVGTTVHNNKCVFLDTMGRCSIQLATTTEGMGRWSIKPLFCILFPVEITNKVIGFDDLLQDDATCCSVSTKFDVPLFEACKDELVHLLGEDGFRAMQEYYNAQPTTIPAATARIEQ